MDVEKERAEAEGRARWEFENGGRRDEGWTKWMKGVVMEELQ